MQPENTEVPINGEVLSRMMLGCLLYRLGGEQTFTPEEIDEIRKYVSGVQFFVAEDDRIILRTRGPQQIEGARLI